MRCGSPGRPVSVPGIFFLGVSGWPILCLPFAAASSRRRLCPARPHAQALTACPPATTFYYGHLFHNQWRASSLNCIVCNCAYILFSVCPRLFDPRRFVPARGGTSAVSCVAFCLWFTIRLTNFLLFSLAHLSLPPLPPRPPAPSLPLSLSVSLRLSLDVSSDFPVVFLCLVRPWSLIAEWFSFSRPPTPVLHTLKPERPVVARDLKDHLVRPRGRQN